MPDYTKESPTERNRGILQGIGEYLHEARPLLCHIFL